MITLRPYQNQAIQSLRYEMRVGNKRLVLCAPTGAGKTFIFSYIISRAIERGNKCLIITHRSELLQQAGGALTQFNLIPQQIKPNKKCDMSAQLFTGMAQTLKRRLNLDAYKLWFKTLDLVIIDEAHTQDANLILEALSDKTIVIGATATPYRESNQKSLDTFYQSITEVTTVGKLINDGFLAKPESYGVKVDLSKIKIKAGDFDNTQVGQMYDDVKLYQGVYENYQKITPNKKAIIFASSVESSKTLVSDFKAKGLPIEHIDGETPTAERQKILNWFKNTPNAIVSNVGILNAGFDDPTIKVVILYRATKSLPLFLQMCGRGSRTTKDKSSFTILDFGNNITRHGFWEEDRKWSLKPAKKKKEGAAPVKDCPECSALLHTTTKVCDYCGHVFEKTEKEKEEEIIAQLEKMSYQQIKDEIATADFKKLEQIAKAKNYATGWIYHQLKTISDLEAYSRYKSYDKRWVQYQLRLREENMGMVD